MARHAQEDTSCGKNGQQGEQDKNGLMSGRGTIIGRFSEIYNINDGELDDGQLAAWDGVEFRVGYVVPVDYAVPAIKDTVQHITNIDPLYLHTESGPKICESRPHYQGDIFWGTVTSYHPIGTVLPIQQTVQVPRRVRNTRKPHYLAVKKVRATSYNNVVRGWVKTQWNPKYFYPKKGTSILKKRRHQLKSKPVLPVEKRYNQFDYLLNHWVPGTHQEAPCTWLRGCETSKQQTTTIKKGLFADSDDEE